MPPNFMRVPGRFLKVGTPLPLNLYGPNQLLLIAKGGVIRDQAQCDALLRIALCGLKAEVLPLLGPAVNEAEEVPDPTRSLQSSEPPRPFDDLAGWFRRAQALYDNPVQFPARLLQLASEIQERVPLYPDAYLAGLFLVPFRHYTAAHGVHCALLASRLAPALALDSAQSLLLNQALLSMNLSVHALQDGLFHVAAPLNHACREALCSHPESSAKALSQRGIEDAQLLALVQQHHERPDGTGYPAGLTAADIAPLAPTVQALDVIAARLTHRGYREPLAPQQALGLLLNRRSEPHCHEIVQHLVKQTGRYPAGTFVQLRNGETGVCLGRTVDISVPVVRALLNPDGSARLHPVLRDVRHADCALARVLPYTVLSGKFTNLNAIFGFGPGA